MWAGPPCSSKIRLVTDSQRIQKRLWEVKNGVLGGLSATWKLSCNRWTRCLRSYCNGELATVGATPVNV
jgi:hypothetical protein